MDSGFCVLEALGELKAHRVFSSAVIKKRKYWPKHIDGEKIKEYFKDKIVGDVDSIGGTIDGHSFDIFCMKDEPYVSMIMSTYGTNRRVGEMKSRQTKDHGKVSFKYPEVISNHY